MKGNIRKYKGAYEVSIELPVGEDGRRHRHYERVQTKKKAERRLVELLAALDKGQPPDSNKLTLKDYLHRWHQIYVVVNTRPRTAERYMGGH